MVPPLRSVVMFALATALASCAATRERTSEHAETPIGSPTTTVDQAFLALQNGDTAGALAQFENVWNQGTRDAEVAFQAARTAAQVGDEERALSWVGRLAETEAPPLSLLEKAPELEKVRAHPEYAATVQKVRAAQQEREKTRKVGVGLERVAPESAGLDSAAVQALLAAAKANGSTDVVVLRDGKVVVEYHAEGYSLKTETMSATKSITALAIAFLVEDGKASFDDPVYEFFPEWKQGRKQQITLRHLLSHTSGLQADRTTGSEIYPSPDFVKLALAAELSSAPGAEFFYNNKAANLLPGIVRGATGKRMDEYLAEKLFAPLEIEEFGWSLDRAGNPHGMSGLQLNAADFAKIGQLMLDGGRWNGRQLLSKKIVDELMTKSQDLNPGCGLMWWLGYEQRLLELEPKTVDALAATAEHTALAEKVRPIAGTSMPPEQFMAELKQRLGPDAQMQLFRALAAVRAQPKQHVSGRVRSFSAIGSYGQRLVVFPEKRLVAVNLKWITGDEGPDQFDQFVKLADALVP